ncbi:unnamed protein product [Prorocentrum cordatum]|uniref:Uncharacterized protein n=1 Tax=Prorocentrum cordatum TaxID=2364126 RepID=A0ABN9PZL3_9DINO|nr:unnamed protein product [Polarella glacialis]
MAPPASQRCPGGRKQRRPRPRAWQAAALGALGARAGAAPGAFCHRWSPGPHVLTRGGDAAAWVGPRCCGGGPRPAVARRSAERQPGAASRSWRRAAEDARLYEQRLNWVRGNASSAVRELDGAFLRNATIGEGAYPRPPRTEPRRGQNRTRADVLGLTELFEDSQPRELMFPDAAETPPVLVGEWATGQPIVGKFSSDPSLVLPPQQYGAMLTMGAADDPRASREENELWKETLSLLSETLGPLYSEAEDLVAKVRAAEERAEGRRGPVIEEFRKRVIQQMIYATDGIYDPEQLEELLAVLQVDSRLTRYLSLLERSAIRAEDLQAQIRIGQEAFSQLPEGSRDRDSAAEGVQRVYEETHSLDAAIRSCVRAAQELPETWDAEEKLREEWDKINPFKMFR